MHPLLEIHPYKLADAALMTTEISEALVWTVSEPCVVVGQSNRVQLSLDLEALARDDIPVFRRPSGGQPVLLSPRTLQISVVFDEPRLMNPRLHFEHINGVVREAIRDVLGLDLLLRGFSDLAAPNERKVLGSSIYRSRGRILYHGVLNVSESPAFIARYLLHPPEEPDYRKGRPHEDFITSLAELSGNTDLSAVSRAVFLHLSEIF